MWKIFLPAFTRLKFPFLSYFFLFAFRFDSGHFVFFSFVLFCFLFCCPSSSLSLFFLFNHFFSVAPFISLLFCLPILFVELHLNISRYLCLLFTVSLFYSEISFSNGKSGPNDKVLHFQIFMLLLCRVYIQIYKYIYS